MGIYGYISLGANVSGLIGQLEIRHESMRGFERGVTEPTIKVVGQLWNRTDYPSYGEAYLRWNGSAWTLQWDPDHAQINAGGTVPFTANQPMGVHKLTGLAAGSANGDSVRYEQVLLLAGGTMSGAIAMGTNKITGLGNPAANQDAATKIYVDNAVANTQCVSGTFAPPASSTASAVSVALGFQPSRVAISFDNITITIGGSPTANVFSTAAVYQGTGTQRGILVTGAAAATPAGPYIGVLTFTATGFDFAMNACNGVAFSNFGGTMRYVAWK